MTKTCSQCGAVLPYSVRACNFCDSSFTTENSPPDDFSATLAATAFASQDAGATVSNTALDGDGSLSASQNPAWRGEVAQRMQAYRSRKRKGTRHVAQSQLPFDEADRSDTSRYGVALAEPCVARQDEFSFTIAIGRDTSPREKQDSRMEIDVSIPAPSPHANAPARADQELAEQYGLYPVASLDERRLAAFIDFACLLFAYGGFLALFSSLGGQFTLSKLSAEIYGVTIAIVYLQYFALFTIFGGTTPGMMFRGLQVMSFTGDPPTPRQMLFRSAGYVLSAGAFFLGFFWAWWDEDALTWHDRMSRTYLSVPQAQAGIETPGIAPSHSR